LLGLIVSRYCFGTLDEQAGIDAQSPTNQSEYHNGTNAKPTASARNASKTSSTTIFNAVASGQFIDAHTALRKNGEAFHLMSDNSASVGMALSGVLGH
jgi:hypothetical protein